MATFTPSLSGVKGARSFHCCFVAPLVQAADNTAIARKDGETLTVTADPHADGGGHERLSAAEYLHRDVNQHADAGYPAGGQYRQR